MTEKTVVLTMYGRGDRIDEISVTLFDNDNNFYRDQNAISYCQNINRLKLQNDEWISAMVILKKYSRICPNKGPSTCGKKCGLLAQSRLSE